MRDIQFSHNHVKHAIFLSSYLAFFTHFFYYYQWNPTIAGHLSYLFYMFPALILLFEHKKVEKTHFLFGREYVLFAILPLFSYITKIIYYHEPLHDLYKDLCPLLLFLLYHVLVIKRISVPLILKIVLLFGFVTFLIQVFQIQNPDSAMFGQNIDPESIGAVGVIEVRNGINRYRLDGMFYMSIFAVMFYWNKLQNKFTLFKLFLFICFLVSIYLYLARQIIAVVLLTLAISLILRDKTPNIFKYFVFLIIGFLLFFYFDNLFGTFLSKTNEEFNTANIRSFSYTFLFERCLSNPYIFLFGNGNPSIVDTWKETLDVYTNDVGFVGEWFNYGLIRLLVYIVVVYKILWKYSNYIPLYLKLFVLCICLDSILIHPFQRQSHMIVWTLAIYIAEIYIKKNMRDRALLREKQIINHS